MIYVSISIINLYLFWSQGHSFLKSDESELLTVTLKNEQFWAKECRAKEQKSERAKKRILNPAISELSSKK